MGGDLIERPSIGVSWRGKLWLASPLCVDHLRFARSKRDFVVEVAWGGVGVFEGFVVGGSGVVSTLGVGRFTGAFLVFAGGVVDFFRELPAGSCDEGVGEEDSE